MSGRVVAVDLGATSGRVIAGTVGEGELRHDVVHRFPNGPDHVGKSLHWNATGLLEQVLQGMAAVGGEVVSVGVDSWGVDYGLIKDGELLWQPHHYRDDRNLGGVEAIHAKSPHAELFRTNGLQYMSFNTIYQLACEDWSGAAATADHMLLMPDLMNHWLSGAVGTEITNASTTGLADVTTGLLHPDLIALTGAPGHIFAPIVHAGQQVGELRDSIAARVGFQVPVVSVGSHDTASAVAATPMVGDTSAYISSGTWGLVGVETEHPIVTDAAREGLYTNERGVDGRIRFLQNIMGLWLLNESVDYWREQGSDVQLTEVLAKAADYDGVHSIFDPNDQIFMAPGDMPVRIASWCEAHDIPVPDSEVAMVASIIESLAVAFAESVGRASMLSGKTITQINMVGGGSQNTLLCQRLADASGLPVVAGPVEAAALGNLLVQARTAGLISGDLEALRALVRKTHDLASYTPTTHARKVARGY
jgi:rhamnulokinase